MGQALRAQVHWGPWHEAAHPLYQLTGEPRRKTQTPAPYLQGYISISCRSFTEWHFSCIDDAHKKHEDGPDSWKIRRALQLCLCYELPSVLCSTLEVVLLLQYLHFSYKSKIYHMHFPLSCNIAIGELILHKGMWGYLLGRDLKFFEKIWFITKKEKDLKNRWKKSWFLASFSVSI